MADFNLDRIRFRWKGDWIISTPYVKDDIVHYEGKSYVCLISHQSSSNTIYPDLNLAAPNTRWELIFDGNQWRGDWVQDTFYYRGNIIKYNGYLYQCVTEHQSTNVVSLGPIANIVNWTIVATTYNWLNTWTPSVDAIDEENPAVPQYYNLGDVVIYNGITYICTQKHVAANSYYLGLEADQSNWAVVTRSDNWRTNWSANTRYTVDDIVKYGAITYRCITSHTSNILVDSGLEVDQTKWEIFLEGIEYKGDWEAEARYKKYDIVKYGGSLWRSNQGHTSSTSLRIDEVKWDIWVPGFEYEQIWTNDVEYNKGDIVVYGGYSYTALTNNTASVPSVNGLVQDTGDWELLKQGYRHLGDWANDESYKTGDVIRDQGYLYIATTDNTGVKPDTDDTKWQILVTGRKWKNTWIDNDEYHLGDVVTYAGVTYICILRHLGTESDNRPDLDIENTNNNYWRVLIQGTASNVMTTRGDLRTHDGISHVRFPVGAPGNVLKTIDGRITWENFEEVPNVFYVSTSGTDVAGAGLTLNAPFRTVKYACDYVASNVNNDTTNSTIFIKTGIYEELLPIKVPRNCVLVGDELRSTVITPDSASLTSNMFYVNNGSGIRNMTLQGLTGTLLAPNVYLTRRPTAGAYVSLDPGTGPDDESVWIINKSCYVQNVTTFGTGCVGMKIDGDLHNGGNRSVVANDFTQVLSDGIGYWALNGGRSELVSVFTYFCHIGYLAENGGTLRATNGNNSYGTYGSVAEGVSLTEVPISAELDNRTLEAQVDIVHTTGSQLVAIGYSHAGQSYTNATAAISGAGINASVTYDEFRNNAISQLRKIDPSDSSTPGGLNYQYLLNNAQNGDLNSITLAASDIGIPSQYIGMRIVIVSGVGVGQYGVITGYNEISKIAAISKEYNGAAGWENLYPGRPIEASLDTTTRYSLEPRVIIDTPGFTVDVNNTTIWPAGFANNAGIKSVKLVNGTYIAIGDAGAAAISTDGITFTTSVADLNGDGSSVATLPSHSTHTDTAAYFLSTFASKVHRYTPSNNTWTNFTLPIATNGYNYIAVNPSTGFHVAVDGQADSFATFTTDGATIGSGSFTTINTPIGVSGLAYGNGIWVVIKLDGSVAYSTNNASTWTETATLLPVGDEWIGLAYGNGRFVAVGSANSAARAVYSFDAVTWYTSDESLETLPNINLSSVKYLSGEFIAQAIGGDTVAKSKDGWAWQWFDEDSTVYNFANASGTIDIVGSELWCIAPASTTVKKLSSGAGAIARAIVSSSRIQSFNMYDPGANYQSTPGVVVFDPLHTVDVLEDPRIASGVLAQPVFTHRGDGYVTATMQISGDGFADIFQTGKTIKLKNVTLVPGPGANVVINGIDDITYRLTKIISQSGSAPNFDLTVTISPTITNENSPEHNESVIIREQYSQVRLTGHDFLDIGTGNTTSTRYPNLYLEGEDPANPRQPFNEAVDNGGGRVFYTSTDQDGNFRVGELFAVEQATGTVTVNADLFELNGLTELSLGGIQVGGSAVIIREFSKDATFVANSNNIVPTQAAIIKYLQSRISSGGADALTNALIAGQVRISGNNISTRSGNQINIPVPVNHLGNVSGDYLAIMMAGL
jgi:hypothetical protein